MSKDFDIRPNRTGRLTAWLLSLALALTGGLLATQSIKAASEHLQPGEVEVSKSAKAVEGKVNTWDIELTIRARDKATTSDTILVMDRSSSMNHSGRFTAAKAAAKSLIDKLLHTGNTTNRIAIVSFADNATTDQAFTFSNTDAKAAIDNMRLSVGTYTQAGMYQASNLLASSTAQIKNIVLLSDGEPTYSVQMHNPDDYLINYPGYGRQTSADAPQSAYNYGQRVGDHSSMYYRYASGKYYNHGNSAIAEAGYFKATGLGDLYTIALSAGANGSYVINRMASPGKAYNASPSELDAIFNSIAGNIAAAAKDVIIEDEIAKEFQVISANDATISGNQVSWNNVQLSTPDENGVRTATRTIRIELASDFTANNSQHLYNTNQSVAFKYTSADGTSHTKTTDSPKVNPVLIHTQKVVNGNKADTGDSFNITVADNLGVNHGGQFTGSAQSTANTARQTGLYTIDEVITGGMYDTTYQNSMSSGKSFTLNSLYQSVTDTTNSDNDIYVTVTNTATLGSLKIVKTLGDCNSTSSNSGSGTPFTFEVKNAAGDTVQTVTLNVTEQACRAETTISNLPQGYYTVTEQNAADYRTAFTVGNVTSEGKTAQVKIGLNQISTSETITFNNRYDKKVNLTANKVWVGGKTSDHTTTFTLYRGETPVSGSQQTVTGNATVTWENMPEADIYGNPYQYSVKETPAANYTMDCSNINNGRCPLTNNSTTITNTYETPLTEYSVIKKWVGGPAQTSLTVTLLQNGVQYKTATLTPANNWQHTWSNLEATDANGNPYTYSVDEVGVENYTKSIDGNVITNTYVSPKIDFTGTKVWVNGPSVKPDVTLQLYRNGTALGEPITLTGGATTYTWTGLDKTDSNGQDYVYTIDEVAVPINYEKSLNTSQNTVTNTYVSPKKDITATKTWVNGPDTHPQIELQLYRNGVALGEPVTLTSGTTTHTWRNLDVTDNNGAAYKYTVNELVVPDSYDKTISEDGLTITNTYVIPTNGEAAANKVWVNGPSVKPTVWFKLYRSNGVVKEAVPGAEIKQLDNGVERVVWRGLERTDIKGNPYTFSVQEVDANGRDFTPTNYLKTEDGLTITNTYVIPTNGEAAANKVWVNGPSVKPTVWFKLYRSNGVVKEAVPGAEIKQLDNGVERVVWRGLERTDIAGREYAFSVLEVNSDGIETSPVNYQTTYAGNGLTVINTYIPPKVSYTVEKIWRNAPDSKPAVQIQLYRNGTALGEAVTLADGVNSHTWTELDETDVYGEPYVYTVDELNIPELYIKHVDGNRITNTYAPPAVAASGQKLAKTGDSLLAILALGGSITLLGALILKRQHI